MVNSLENIDKSKVYVDRIEGLDEVVSDVISDTLTGAVSTITTSDLTAGKVLVSDNNGKVAAGSDALSDLVHKTGNEIITGDKSFNSSNDYHYIHIGNTSHSYDENVNNSLYSGIIFEDKNNVEAGFVRRIQNNTDNMLQLGIKGKDGTLNQSFLGIDSSGNKFMTAPTPTDTTTTSGNQVATTGWVNSTGNNVIHKTNDETISGVKTFTGDGWITKIQNTDVTYNTAPSSIKPTSIIFTDKNGTQMGCVECQRYPNNNTLVRFNAYSPNGNWASQTLELMIDANDNVSAFAPTPTNTYSATSGTQIATTGWTASNFVNLAGAQTISGEKTFSTTNWANPDGTTTTAATAQKYSDGHFFIFMRDESKEWLNALELSPDGSIHMGSWSGKREIIPYGDNTHNLGNSSSRWKQLYAGTTTISTSDERLKQDIENISDEILDVWGKVEFYRYKFKDAVAEKGENARYHTGLIAQRIERIFAEHGLNAFDYGLLCYDEWEAEEEEKDEEGSIIRPAMEAGNRYSLRYEECLCMEAAYQRRRADRIEERLRTLEEKLK